MILMNHIKILLLLFLVGCTHPDRPVENGRKADLFLRDGTACWYYSPSAQSGVVGLRCARKRWDVQ